MKRYARYVMALFCFQLYSADVDRSVLEDALDLTKYVTPVSGAKTSAVVALSGFCPGVQHIMRTAQSERGAQAGLSVLRDSHLLSDMSRFSDRSDLEKAHQKIGAILQSLHDQFASHSNPDVFSSVMSCLRNQSKQSLLNIKN